MTEKIFQNIFDSTPDLSHTDQLTVIVRYALDSGPIEGFLKCLPLTSHKGETLGEKCPNAEYFLVRIFPHSG